MKESKLVLNEHCNVLYCNNIVTLLIYCIALKSSLTILNYKPAALSMSLNLTSTFWNEKD